MQAPEPSSSGSSRIGLTLETYILEGMLGRPRATGTFTSLLNQVALAAKLITSRVRRAGLANVLGYTGDVNVQGEKVKKLDVIANETMVQVLSRRHHCAAIASEEEQTIRVLTEDPNARYLLLFDPLDGSSNIEVNVSIGTIFGILRKGDTEPTAERHFLRRGREQVAAGYVIYGSSTMLVLTTGEGVHGFTYDPTVGEFFLSHENIRVPPRGAVYAINEANDTLWDAPVRSWVRALKQPRPDGSRGRTMRWVGSMVADAHRTLLRGGVFAYPSDRDNPDGKLRLLYEANPFALLFEAAGGAASTGRQRVLDLEPTKIHQRTPLILGSRDDVADAEKLLAGG